VAQSNLWSQDLYVKALRFAANAHNGQTVTGTQLPYVVHVVQVCMEVIAALQAEPGHDGNLAIQCALLHDVIEDTTISDDELRREFGPSVVDGVQALTKNSTLPKEVQLRDSLDRIQRQPSEVWMVKLGDRISNLQPPPADWSRRKIIQYRQDASEIHAMLAVASPLLAERLLRKIEAYRAFEAQAAE
jgi:(p)ppGpp synthase/HD superfamily hydrolase